MKDQWPADEKDAYKMVAHHVFEAFYDTGSSTGAGGSRDNGSHGHATALSYFFRRRP